MLTVAIPGISVEREKGGLVGAAAGDGKRKRLLAGAAAVFGCNVGPIYYGPR